LNIIKSKNSYLVPLLVVMSLMFFWNLTRNINDVLIPHLKRACQLTDLQSSLVQSAFFGAYFLLALPAGHFINKYGYKAGMVAGLAFAALGAALFYPAAETRFYPVFLGALFIMASGFTFLEVTATPYISKLGDQQSASSRLSLSAAAGSVGATIAPYIGSLLLLHKEDIAESTIMAMDSVQLDKFLEAEANMVKLPYLTLAALFSLVAILIFSLKLPPIKDEQTSTPHSIKETLKFRHTSFGVLAVFAYVGAEVGIVSFMIRYSKSLHIEGLTEQKAAIFISVFMGLVLVGRVAGAWVLKNFNPQRMLLISASGAFILVLAAMFFNSYTSLWLFAIIGFFTSIMYPIIFTLSIRDLGSYTRSASSVLILGIVGGAIVPPIMGFISDHSQILWSFILPLICYAYVVFFALNGSRIKACQTFS
jgi:MFS transporter, FHS family, L-fucose permease